MSIGRDLCASVFRYETRGLRRRKGVNQGKGIRMIGSEIQEREKEYGLRHMTFPDLFGKHNSSEVM